MNVRRGGMASGMAASGVAAKSGGTGGGFWRCFVGLPLPESWRTALDALVRRLSGRLASRIRWTRPGNWHLTLKFLGATDPARVPDVAAALARISLIPFEVAMGGSGFFPRRGTPRVVWAGLAAGAAESERLAEAVEAAAAPLGFAPDGRPFAAHLTLGRIGSAAENEEWSCVERALREVAWPVWRAERMVLWRSVSGLGGPRYVALREFSAG